ncbi:MAG TPA: OmpA family protein [Bacteroidetes bacterium]|nr:OmpA family protein [Bacteroidota bacterium]
MKIYLTLVALCCVCLGILPAQITPPTKQSDHTLSNQKIWEGGLHAGHFFVSGNVDFIPGFATGVHMRKALDYVFSLRLDLMYGSARGEADGNVRSFSSKWMSGSVQGIASLNNLKWSAEERKTNIYALFGVGMNSFSTELTENGEAMSKIGNKAALHTEVGAGIAFRINEKVNIGIEHKTMVLMGSRADMLDGVSTLAQNPDGRAAFKDLLNYTSVRLNYNLGTANRKIEPLYWLNPMDAVQYDIATLKYNQISLSDIDGDGVVDALDTDNNTPKGAPVDVKGVELDSDQDGIADHEDKEPFSPSGYQIDKNGVAQIPDISEEINKLVEEKMKALREEMAAPNTAAPDPAPIQQFLPSVYFASSSDKIQTSDYSNLANLATTLLSNPELKLVVTGFADESGDEGYNDQLSYRRAKAVVGYLENTLRVNREQLVLQWKGERGALVPGQHPINRRVAFKFAENETEMAAPAKSK